MDTQDDTNRHTGGCLCGNLRYEVKAPLKAVGACHCKQCRRWSGHYWASAECPIDKFRITRGADLLSWYVSSDFARRGFCKACGSALFWQADRHETWKDHIAVSAGSLDEPTNLRAEKHIFCQFKGDYYDLSDGLPQESTET
ncbi:GFA family protein [Kiloniella laminariae]|uniref:GFA family protein n=1 Tax=Kiloniella laminariae TaxID=454162 RepID=A0ABT4LJF6_9PROT|nr:GFA family protein [Kiloniella laminariae]MCZ4281219.1 GFA family protein [Kiloniella laminariae]